MRIALSLLLLTLASCGSSGKPDGNCYGEFAIGVIVELTDSVTGLAIPGAKATLRSGNGEGPEEVMQEQPAQPMTIYYGATDQGGTFALRIEAAGYAPHAQKDIVVKWDGCRLDTQRIKVQLTRSPESTPIVLITVGPEGADVHEGVLHLAAPTSGN